jgi:hypothetical protein
MKRSAFRKIDEGSNAFPCATLEKPHCSAATLRVSGVMVCSR